MTRNKKTNLMARARQAHVEWAAGLAGAAIILYIIDIIGLVGLSSAAADDERSDQYVWCESGGHVQFEAVAREVTVVDGATYIVSVEGDRLVSTSDCVISPEGYFE